MITVLLFQFWNLLIVTLILRVANLLLALADKSSLLKCLNNDESLENKSQKHYILITL